MADSQELVAGMLYSIAESENFLVSVYANRHTLMEHSRSNFDIPAEQSNTLIEQSNDF